MVAAAGVIALFVALLAYDRALAGPFLFDDFGLPFYARSLAQESVASWMSGVRPLLMLSYWCNFQLAGRDPQSYHMWNVLLHTANSILVFLLVRRVLSRYLTSNRHAAVVAGCAAALFLLHPLQTESVAYISGRSELLSGLFVLAAMLVFTYSTDVIGWRSVIAIALLYGCAAASKEQAVVLPAVFLLTDVVLNGRGVVEAIRRRSRLYLTLSAVGLIGLAATWRALQTGLSAGFHVPGLVWYEYLFTQLRVLFLYVRLSLIPVWQNADYDIALSHSILEHGSFLALIAAAAALWAAWRVRHRYPLIPYGVGLFLLFLAPTSSVIPIKDLAAERRMYVPMLGLLFIAVQPLLRMRAKDLIAAASIVTLVFGVATYERCKVWSSRTALWEDVISKSPKKPRGYEHLVMAYVQTRRCNDAIRLASGIPDSYRDTPEFLTNWSKALECVHRNDEALDKLKRAAAISPTAGRYLLLGWAYERFGLRQEAAVAINTALHSEVRGPLDREAIRLFEEQSRGRIRTEW